MDKQAVRSVFYHRLYWLWPILARRRVQCALAALGWSLVALYFAFAALVLVLRHGVLPNVGQYLPEIEGAASQAVGLPVRIGSVEAGWDGLNPHFTLSEVVVADRAGRPAFTLDRVDSVLSWTSLWHLQPMLRSLTLEGPVLNVRRDESGRITVAGLATEGESDPRLQRWLLGQSHIRIRDAIIVWEDNLRGAPPLILEDLQFGLDNRGEHHRFGLSAAPPAQLAARIDIRGDVRGSPGDALDELVGRFFVELDYADLAAWRTWVDYPVDLPQGRGALRVWADWNRGEGRATADVALEDVGIRLGEAVPRLDLASMRGRLSGRYSGEEWDLAGSKVELRTLDGIRITPTDFRIKWRHDDKSGLWSGSATASVLDLDALVRLADYLPLDSRSRELLATHQPQGRIAELKAGWEGNAEALRRYSLRARFDGLGMRAAGRFPGAAGLAGDIDASEHGGTLSLDSRDAGIDLPAVFAEPHLALGALKARVSWLVDGQALDVRLDRLDFSGPDAAGTARGTYHYDGDGPGVIDLTAGLSRAAGTAVWRYMPKVVNANARDWLQRGITRGTASDARLVLKGDLRHFPFRDRSRGQFLVTAKAHGVSIDYAPGWPTIDGIDGDMSFGVGMRVEARQGSILGTQIGPVVVDIPDFEAREQKLLVRGAVVGPTSEFLRFIDLSPVGDKIERFTEEMRALGNGHLDLHLDMPLGHVTDTRVRGEYQFQNNQVNVIPGLPPLTQVNGRLKLTENTVTAQEITAQIFGGPMRLSVRNDGDRVNVAIAGTANLREVRRHFDLPLLEQVTGSTAWKGEVRVRKKSAEFVVESGLTGVSSSLPEPFNKTAATVLPLRVEKKGMDTAKDGAARDQIRVSLGKVAEALVMRRQDGEAMRIERGVVAVGDSLPAMPERGLAVAVNVPRLDVDQWRRLTARDANGGNAAAGGGMISQMQVRTPSLRLLNRNYAGVELNLKPRENGWQIGVVTKEAVGDLFWRESGGGWLQADFRRLYLPAESQATAEVPEAINNLPGLDIHVGDFAIGDKRLGRLDLKAHNESGTWHLDNVSLQNPDANLKGRGEWVSSGGQRTHLNFEMAASDLGKLLDRLGYAGAIKRGTANLKGDLTWAGPLTSIHYPTLSGDMNVSAAKGQFAKIEPGIGKLLGLLSLQSLPRRLSLDFRDIFSEGFAFDSIESKLAVKGGIMRTVDDLQIEGPAARILMKGQADLRHETQEVLVTVQPEVGNVVSFGAIFLAHPAVGAAAALANKILQNPLSKMFSFQYLVSGSWIDPKIEKVGQMVQEAPTRSEENRKK